VTDWDARYASGEGIDASPLPLLVQVVDLLPPGRALDLACGAGRHALYLARLGWQVTAVDSSPAAIDIVRRSGLPVDAQVADLTRYQIAADTYDLICDFFYLQRDLFPQIRAGVCTGGVFAGAIHLVDDRPGVKPMNPDYLLKSGELRKEFEDWKVLYYSEGGPDKGHRRRAAQLIARKG
jgi:tellurite methyltransferase